VVLSDVSIRRPVFATVISLLLLVLGIAAGTKLPVREYPAIDPPIVTVTTVYKGASAPVVETQVTELIESAIAGIEGIKTITSTSRDERSQVSIEFKLSRDIESAANDTRDKVSRALNRLPTGTETPVIAKVDGDARAILWFTFRSERFSRLELTDIARRQTIDRLSIVPGVASAIMSGDRRYSMRVWIDRQALAARGLTVEDVESAIKRENVELPGGRVESSSREFTVRTDSRLRTPEQFAAITVRNLGGYQVRLGEVARVALGPEEDRSEMRINDKPAVGVGLLRQSTANTLDVANGAKAEMEKIKQSLPEGIEVLVAYDESVFIRESIEGVLRTLAEGMALVIGVIFIFLRSFRATLIPSVTIPVSIVASLTVLAAFGFSINVLTLLALVLAIGIVVDDAIVVLENIHKRIEEGEAPLLAAQRGARQIAFAVIATTLVLISVFVPISFMEGNTGRLFTEFGIALASAVAFSGLIALSLTPMMCSKWLTGHSDEGWLYRKTEIFFDGMHRLFRWTLERALGAPLIVLASGAAVSAIAYQLWVVLPKEFAPLEDRGIIVVPFTAPEGSSLTYTRNQAIILERIGQPIMERGDAFAVTSFISPGFQRPAPVNTGFMMVRLKPWSERKAKQQDIARELMPKLIAVPGVRAFALNPPSLGQRGFQAPIQMVLGGPDYDTVRDWRDRMMRRAAQNPKLLNVDSNYKETKPEFRVAIDRRKAADLGVSIDAIGRTLEVMIGSRDTSSFTDRGEEYKVITQARPEDRATPRDLSNIFMRSTTSGQLIPLSNLLSVSEAAGPQELTRIDRQRSIVLSASLAPGYTMGEAIEFLEAAAAEELPPSARISWQALSREFKDSSSSLYVTFALALLVVFLVLAAQFESWIHPLIIMLAVPLAVTGGFAALWLTGQSLNIFSQIGMILLVGLMAKNGILVVEFANQLRDQGRDIRQAVIEAAVARLRPILMTSIATVFGAVPLYIASGAGAESRRAIGAVIIGGVTLSTLMTLFLVPALYLLLAHLTKPAGEIARRLSELERASPLSHAPAE
jgi:multidrug efflux pump